MKKKTVFILAGCVLVVVAFICAIRYYHPTHLAYNDRFIVGNTQENIVRKYGEFYTVRKNESGEMVCGCYMIHDNTPEFVMSYDDSLWYEIYFEDGIAVRVQLRKGWIGG